MKKSELKIDSFYKAIKHYEEFIDKDGNITDQEKHDDCVEMIKDDLDMFVGQEIREDLMNEIKQLKSLLENHTHIKGKEGVYKRI